jgi:hypothetical protein
MTPSRKLAALAIIGLSLVFIVSVLLKPSTGEYFTICAFKNFTGLPCPGCGLTHSFCSLAKGNVGEAFEFNLLGPPLYIVLLLVWIRSLGVLFNKQGLVSMFDRIAERFKLVRAFAYGFAIYGGARIVYLLVFQPLPLHDSPLSRLLAGLIH